MEKSFPISGDCDARFAAVREAFSRNAATHGETGAALAITIDGRSVVDLCGGWRDAARTQPWTPDTLANVYSTTKGMTALCAHRLVDAARLDPDAPVDRYWPEFAAAGKAGLPVRYLLDHRAGLPAIAAPLPADALLRWETMTAALAAQEPWWEPGTRHGYHGLTFGHLVGEVVRRVTGQSVGAYFRETIAGPFDVDFHFGTPPAFDARTADLIPATPSAEQMAYVAQVLAEPESMQAKLLTNPVLVIEDVNTRAWRAAEVPAANGHATARALARIYGALACSGRAGHTPVLSGEGLERCWRVQSDGPDAMMPQHTRFSLGFMLSTPTERLGPSPRGFGHGGMGGSMAFADPDRGLGFGYVPNEMHMGFWLVDPRAAALIGALYDALD
ncbi:beta-lactamase family protein [Candidatus Binatia bacterium]|nr:beta-lactamase family protein [Candidatus Binatia bacterium]